MVVMQATAIHLISILLDGKTKSFVNLLSVGVISRDNLSKLKQN